MKAKIIAILPVLMLAGFASASAHAEEAEVTLAWQEAGYVMDVVVATSPRSHAQAATNEAATSAWQEPGYEQEVVVVTASRREVLAAAWSERFRLARRVPFMGMPTQ